MSKERCNLCGAPLDLIDTISDYSVDMFVGYGSKHDEEHISAKFCCDCFDKIIDGLSRACAIPIIQDSDEM